MLIILNAGQTLAEALAGFEGNVWQNENDNQEYFIGDDPFNNEDYDGFIWIGNVEEVARGG